MRGGTKAKKVSGQWQGGAAGKDKRAGRGRGEGSAGAPGGGAGEGLDLPRGRTRAPAMGSVARLAALLAVLALRAVDPAGAAAGGDMFSALTSVARALAPERQLLGLLRRYLRGEEARLRDLTR